MIKINIPYAVLGLFIGLLLMSAFIPARPFQGTDACVDGQVIVMSATSKTYKCSTVNLTYRLKAVPVNSALTDVGTITGLPARYIVRRLTGDNASTSLTLATIDLRTAAGGLGTAIVSAGVLSALTDSTKYSDTTLTVASTVMTASTLTVRNVTPQGSAATIDLTLEVTPLP